MKHVMCAAMVAAFFPFLLQAEPLKEGRDWRYCSSDDQCVMIDGLCDKTAVNWQVEEEAIAFYNQERATAKCVERFWRAGEKMPRCHLGGCETITKQAANPSPKPTR